jgi:hypothetical protein
VAGLSVRVKVLPLFGDHHPRRRDHSYGRRDATSPNSDTSWLPGHEGTGQGLTNVWGRICLGAVPRSFLDCLVTNPDNEPELSLREAASLLLALIVSIALMAWAAMQWM